MTPEETAILDAVEARRDDLVALTQAPIRIPSVNPPGADYAACASLVAEHLSAHGLACETLRAEGAPADTDAFPRLNVIARKAGGEGPCVHFNSHYDVVPPAEGWTRDPYGAEIADGRIYGRGTCDMKGGLAASMIAAEALADLGGWRGAIEVSGVADEESGGFGGAACRTAISALRARTEYIPAIAQRLTHQPVTPDAARRSSLNIATLHGGQPDPTDGGFPAPNVPDRATLICDRRLIPEEDLDEAKAELRALLDRVAAERGFDYELKDLFEVRPTLTDRDGPVTRATAAAIEQVTGRRAEIVLSPGTYDQKHFDQIGGVHDVIAYGPGILDLAHQPDEYVDIEDLVASAKVMALAAWRLLRNEA